MKRFIKITPVGRNDSVVQFIVDVALIPKAIVIDEIINLFQRLKFSFPEPEQSCLLLDMLKMFHPAE